MFSEWAKISNRKFLSIFQAATQTEIRPDSAISIEGLLEFQDGSEVFDVAAYSLANVTPC